jgi:nucleotide-binding universal stress UspA family protein
MRVLVCFDGSAASRAALAAARQLTEGTESEVHLVKVSYHNLSTGGVPWSGSERVDIEKHRRALAEDAETHAEMEAVAMEMSVPARVAVLNGRDVAEELIRYARAQHVDLIAVGCRQRGPLHGGVGGELTLRLTESRVAPVLLGRMTLAAPLKLASIPLGTAVFSHDGFLLGELARVGSGSLTIHMRDGTELVVSADDALELSVASGLRLTFDAAEVEEHAMPEAVLVDG